MALAKFAADITISGASSKGKTCLIKMRKEEKPSALAA